MLAVVTHHGQLAALAAPFVLGPAVYFRRESAPISATLQSLEPAVGEHEIVHAVLTLSSPEDVDLVEVRLNPGSTAPVGSTTRSVSLAAGEECHLAFELEAGHWGRRFVGPAMVRAYGPALLGAFAPTVTESARVIVAPKADSFKATQDVPHALVYAGDHRSSHNGAGMLFSHVRPFNSGDRLRRINWRATLKSSQLHVTATHAERSARVLIAIDSARDIGPRGQSVLDVSVRAAAAITEFYISSGDTVGLVECRSQGRQLRPAPGRRQEDRIRQWLLDTVPVGAVHDEADTVWLSTMSVSRSLILVLTPLLSEDAPTNLLRLRQRGASLIAVDTLSLEAQPDSNDRVSEIARRLWLLERDRVIHRLGDAGIPVVAWRSNASLEGVLRDVARIAAAPRLVNR